MTFLWPASFYLLGLIPAPAGLYFWIQTRRQRYAVRYSSLSLVRDILPTHSWLRRHLPFMLLLCALSSVALAMTRPVSIVSVPAGQTTIVLAIDVSRSMCSTDVAPNRLEAAKAAAAGLRAELGSQPADCSRCLLGFRRADPAAYVRSGSPRGRDPEPDHGSPNRDR